MIIDKKSGQVLSGNKPGVMAPPPPGPEAVPVEVQVESNGPIDVLEAVKEILRGVAWEYGVPGSPKIFKTVQVDDGQYERIISPGGNTEETLGFPAAFVHFIDWSYLVQQGRINEGRALLRIRFILNRLDTHEDGRDTAVYYVAERINQAMQEGAAERECLQERCRLQYIDPMESFEHGLQPCWMTYEIWFRQRNVWVTRNKVYKKLVFPPFANHADQEEPPEGHTNLDHPREYDEASGYSGN